MKEKKSIEEYLKNHKYEDVNISNINEMMKDVIKDVVWDDNKDKKYKFSNPSFDKDGKNFNAYISYDKKWSRKAISEANSIYPN